MATKPAMQQIADWHVAILIPARDEEALLPLCLNSLMAARAMLPSGITSDVVVVSDRSTDRTVALGRRILGTSGTVVASQAGCVGAARALAAQIALARHNGAADRCWLANTDADCEVPVTWLRDQVRIAQHNHAAVTGIVDVRDFSEHQPTVEQRFRLSYKVAQDGTHAHVHGANLGVRADVYLRAGGWSDLESAEDHDLWKRLRLVTERCVSDGNLRVNTSGRRIGRAPRGFAIALAAHNDDSVPSRS